MDKLKNNINKENINWSNLLDQYLNRADVLRDIISENTHIFKQRISDLQDVIPLIEYAKNSTSPSRSLLFRVLYEYLEPTSENLELLKHNSTFLNYRDILEIRMNTAEIDKLFGITHNVDEKLVRIFEAGITGEYDIMDSFLRKSEDNYINNPIFKLMMKPLFINWKFLEALMDCNGVRPFQNICFNIISHLCRTHIPLWLEYLDTLCETREEKWKFLIGWQSFGLSKVLTVNLQTHKIPTQYGQDLKHVLSIIDKKLEFDFNYTSQKRKLFTDLLNLDEFASYKAQIAFYKTQNVESITCPIFDL